MLQTLLKLTQQESHRKYRYCIPFHSFFFLPFLRLSNGNNNFDNNNIGRVTGHIFLIFIIVLILSIILSMPAMSAPFLSLSVRMKIYAGGYFIQVSSPSDPSACF